MLTGDKKFIIDFISFAAAVSEFMLVNKTYVCFRTG